MSELLAIRSPLQLIGANISFLGSVVWHVHAIKVIIYTIEFSLATSQMR